jgi:hypothetical protein
MRKVKVAQNPFIPYAYCIHTFLAMQRNNNEDNDNVSEEDCNANRPECDQDQDTDTSEAETWCIFDIIEIIKSRHSCII